MFYTINGSTTETAGCDVTVHEFAGTVMQRLGEMLGNGYSISVSSPRKNNGMTPTGISIMKTGEGTDAAVIIYLEDYLGSFNGGDMGIEEICADIISIYHDQMRGFDFDVHSISSFEKVKDRICCRLVNAKMNREKIHMLPHRLFMDLAVTYFIPLRVNGRAASITINSALLESWNVDEGTLYEAAVENDTGYCILSMSDVMKDVVASFGLNGADRACAAHAGPEMYVAKAGTHDFGASFMLHKDLLKEFSDRIQDDFFILPSSIHELLFLPAAGADARDLVKMVKEVNENVLEKKDILSYSVYRYCKEKAGVVIAAKG